MSKFANFVRATLTENISDSATSFGVAWAAPFSRPPDPEGEKAYLLLMDDPRRPTAFEVVSYTRFEGEVQGVTRGEEGTTAQAWPAGTAVTQDLPAKLMKVLAETADPGDVLHMLPFGAFRQVRWQDLVGKPTKHTVLRLVENASPDTPPAGEVHVYLAPDREVRAIFDNGATEALHT